PTEAEVDLLGSALHPGAVRWPTPGPRSSVARAPTRPGSSVLSALRQYAQKAGVMTGQGLLGSRLSPRTLAITVGAAVVLTPISTVALPPDMARAAPALTLLEEVDCATGLDGAAVVFSVDGHEAGQQYWVT